MSALSETQEELAEIAYVYELSNEEVVDILDKIKEEITHGSGKIDP